MKSKLVKVFVIILVLAFLGVVAYNIYENVNGINLAEDSVNLANKNSNLQNQEKVVENETKEEKQIPDSHIKISVRRYYVP